MRIPFALFAFALVVRALLFGLHPDAAYPDSYYYVDVARALQAGHGFNVDFIYSFLDVGGRIPPNPALPIPSNGFWMPLASIVQIPAMWLLGPTTLASALPFILIGSLAAPLTWLVAREIGCRPAVALAAGIAVGCPAAAAIYASQPDNFSLYQPIGLAVLWLTARGLKGHRASFALAGAMVGLASLSRNDGLLLGAVVGLAFGWDRWRTWRSRGVRAPTIPWRYAFACLGLFVLVMAPWYLRQLAVFGSLSPSSGSGRVLFISHYDDIERVTGDISLAAYIGQGLVPLLAGRLAGLVAAIGIFAVLACSLALAPFALVGAWARRHSVDFGPYFVYAGLLFAVSILLFPVFIVHGTFLHSAVALVPYTYILGFEGLAVAVAWVSRHRRNWQEKRATPLFIGTAAGLMILSTAVYAAMSFPSWDAERDQMLAAGRALDAAGAPSSDLVMSADPAGYKYFTGRGGVVTPNDSLDVTREVAADYGIRWLVLERAHIVAPLAPVIESTVRPSWLGPPIYVIPYTGPQTGDSAANGAPALAIYPVCTAAADVRCGGARSASPIADASGTGYVP
ncbi:MAG TPA: glycosyltransferase family 39 protein [Candidatus Limnocylindrales bacterium]